MSGPQVSIVTPSYQQGRFLERTLQSVASQRGAAIEHIVADGGSTDESVAILERWSDRLAFTSGPDRGQTSAINAGLAKTRGAILGYLNSDDVLYAGAVAAAVAAFDADPEVDVVYGDADFIDDADRVVEPYPTEAWSMERLTRICFLCQPAVFFRRRVLERFGPLDERLHHCMDYEYWLRLAMGGARFAHLPVKLAGSRLHAGAKTVRLRAEGHAEVLGMLRERLGAVPDNWLSNYAYALLDARGIARSNGAIYLARIAALTLVAAFRWNRLPSPSLLRAIGSSLIRRPTVRQPVGVANV